MRDVDAGTVLDVIGRSGGTIVVKGSSGGRTEAASAVTLT
jgi:hypothetical protein